MLAVFRTEVVKQLRRPRTYVALGIAILIPTIATIALKANPQHPTYRQFYRNHLTVLITAHGGLLEQQEATRTAETCRTWPQIDCNVKNAAVDNGHNLRLWVLDLEM